MRLRSMSSLLVMPALLACGESEPFDLTPSCDTLVEAGFAMFHCDPDHADSAEVPLDGDGAGTARWPDSTSTAVLRDAEDAQYVSAGAHTVLTDYGTRMVTLSADTSEQAYPIHLVHGATLATVSLDTQLGVHGPADWDGALWLGRDVAATHSSVLHDIVQLGSDDHVLLLDHPAWVVLEGRVPLTSHDGELWWTIPPCTFRSDGKLEAPEFPAACAAPHGDTTTRTVLLTWHLSRFATGCGGRFQAVRMYPGEGGRAFIPPDLSMTESGLQVDAGGFQFTTVVAEGDDETNLVLHVTTQRGLPLTSDIAFGLLSRDGEPERVELGTTGSDLRISWIDDQGEDQRKRLPVFRDVPAKPYDHAPFEEVLVPNVAYFTEQANTRTAREVADLLTAEQLESSLISVYESPTALDNALVQRCAL
jgi:hypothetical protein